jgi:TPP-dependent pyruvate/acetoin dehydrogenase alpha subunit
VQSPLAVRQPDREIHDWAAAHRVAAVLVDGANVLAVHDAARVAVDRARAGGGPTFIEARVYRFRAHGGNGDDSRTGYRDDDERRSWEAHCPVKMFAAYLRDEGVLTTRTIEEMERTIAQEIAGGFEFALASPLPTAEDLYRHALAD